MKNGSRALIFISPTVWILLLAACTPVNGPKNPNTEKVDRVFYAYNFTNTTGNPLDAYYPVNTILLAENERCLVYGELNSAVSVSAARAIAAEYAGSIYPKITGVFGGYEDALKTNKLILLLLDIKDGSSSTEYIAGYFDPKDLLISSENNPRPNQAAMLYLDTNPGKPGDGVFYSTIAHELQHLINFSRHYKTGLQETWINEGLSAAAEYIYAGSHIASKITYFNNDPQGTIAEGNNFYFWMDDGRVLDEYATVYLFFQWLRIQAAQGEADGKAIFTAIEDSTYSDYQAVLGAAQKYIDTAMTWEGLLSSWLLANYVNAGSGLLGYKDEIKGVIKKDLYVKPLTGRPSKMLSPGEGVFSPLTGMEFSLPETDDTNAHIVYRGIGKKGELSSASPFTGQRLLTLNGNTDNAGGSAQEKGMLTGAEDLPATTEEQIAGKRSFTNDGPAPVDGGIFLRNRDQNFNWNAETSRMLFDPANDP
jgi:hypothetical protein